MAKTTAKCKGLCGEIFPVNMMKKVSSYGHNYFYVCPDCATREESYYTENSDKVHKEKKHGFTMSLEVETGIRSNKSNLFYEYGFLPTSDGSISGTEWKTPIYISFNGIKQLLRSVEKIGLFTSDEGCHTNIGNVKLTSDKIESIRKNYVALFKPLSDYLKNHKEDTERIFGRYFQYYAQSIDENSDSQQHELFINMQHNTHIEFRLMAFRTGEQMFSGIMMCREFVGCVMTNYLEYLNENNATIQRKINVTANKLISIFQKYAKKSV